MDGCRGGRAGGEVLGKVGRVSKEKGGEIEKRGDFGWISNEQTRKEA